MSGFQNMNERSSLNPSLRSANRDESIHIQPNISGLPRRFCLLAMTLCAMLSAPPAFAQTIDTCDGTIEGAINLNTYAGYEPPGLIGHWSLDEGPTGPYVDSSPTANNATNINPGNNAVEGIMNNGVNNDNGNGGDRGGVIAASNAAYTSLSAFTISMWVNIEGNAKTNGGLLSLGTFSGVTNFGLLAASREANAGSRRLIVVAPGWSGTQGVWRYNDIFDDKKWVHLAITYDVNDPPGTAPKLYKNGVSAVLGTTNSTTSGSPLTHTTIDFLLARRHGSSWFSDPIDEVRLYNRVLSQAEIQGLYKQRLEYCDGTEWIHMVDKPCPSGITSCGGNPNERVAFVTKDDKRASAIGNIGMAGLDLNCQTQAEAAGLHGNYYAWAADTTTDPATRFEQSTVPYVTTTGVKIADNWTDLTDGSLYQQINTDQTGMNAGSPFGVASNVAVNGTVLDTDNNAHCTNFTGVGNHNRGDFRNSGAGWTNSATGVSCAASGRHYCFEQQTAPTTCTNRGDIYYDPTNNNYRWCDGTYERLMGSNLTTYQFGNCNSGALGGAQPEGAFQFLGSEKTYYYCAQDRNIPVGKRCAACGGDPTRKVAFLTSTIHPLSNIGGLAGADAVCQANAEAANLNGTYLAWLADGDPNSAPATRFSAAIKSGIPIVRTDGATLAANWNDLLNFGVSNRLNVSEHGFTVKTNITGFVRTNVNVDGTQFSSDTSAHCNNFTGGGTILRGAPTFTGTLWTNIGATTSCTTAYHMFCFEQ